jgi:hypothetical protein
MAITNPTAGYFLLTQWHMHSSTVRGLGGGGGGGAHLQGMLFQRQHCIDGGGIFNWRAHAALHAV